MRHLGFIAVALLILPSSIAAAAPSWQTATATSVIAGVNSRSTFAIDAYVTLPQSCYTARIRTYAVTTGLNRSFIVEQRAGSACSGAAYSCVAAQTFALPIQHKFDVHTKGKTWRVTMGEHIPAPTQPLCHKS
ncbi:MAG TPA: hypothetical protein VIW73_12325 [Candidatus Cybelea sp.]